jgi:hypothetical protein
MIVETPKGLDLQFPTEVPDMEHYREKIEEILAEELT